MTGHLGQFTVVPLYKKLSVVVIGILNKINGVGSCVGVLVDLEVGGGETKGS